MCVVENSGRFGGTYAAPIVSFMIEKYLKDSITDKARLARIETLSNQNLMPPRIYSELRRIDSLDHIGDSAYLLQKGYIKIIKDTLEAEDEPEILKQSDMEKVKKELLNEKNKKDTVVIIRKPEAILPDNKKLSTEEDSTNQQQK